MNNVFWKFRFIILAVVFFLVGFIYLIINGSTYTFNYEMLAFLDTVDAESLRPVVEAEAADIFEITDYTVKDSDTISITVRAKKSGYGYIEIYGENDYFNMVAIYVHPFKYITVDEYLGKCRGNTLMLILWLIYQLFVIIHFIRKYSSSVKENAYKYTNVLYLGLIIFLNYYFVITLISFKGENSINDTILSFLDSTAGFVIMTFPMVIILSIIVSVSNIKLIKREGRTWRNMLGFILGIILSIGTILPSILDSVFIKITSLDVYNWTSLSRFVFLIFIPNLCYFVMSYLECVLFGTIITCIKLARYIPGFDKDYILILGSMIRKDGTLTKLL